MISGTFWCGNSSSCPQEWTSPETTRSKHTKIVRFWYFTVFKSFLWFSFFRLESISTALHFSLRHLTTNYGLTWFSIRKLYFSNFEWSMKCSGFWLIGTHLDCIFCPKEQFRCLFQLSQLNGIPPPPQSEDSARHLSIGICSLRVVPRSTNDPANHWPY